MTGLTRGRAAYGLAVLSVINLLNYLDRYLLAGVMAKVQTAFHLSDAQGGLLATTFMAVYLCTSPIGGYLGDRVSRRALIGASVIIWSLATVASGLAGSFALLLVARAATGIGEAGYGTVAPALISDLFRREHRSRMLAVFYTAMPLGAAAGFVLGGWIGDRFGWQYAFFVGGAPGLLLALLAFGLPEPERGAMDGAPPPKIPFMEGARALAGNSRFWIVVGGLTLMTFSIGGLSNWMPRFLESERGFSGTTAGLALGVTTVIGGFGGTIIGGFLGDRLDRWRAGASIVMSGVGLALAAPLMVGAVLVYEPALMLAFLLGAQFLVFLNSGPLNATIVNVVPPGFRAFAFGVSMVTLHALGDAASPTIIGWISDQSSLGDAIILNAVPLLAGGILLLVGTRAFTTPAGATSPAPTAPPAT